MTLGRKSVFWLLPWLLGFAIWYASTRMETTSVHTEVSHPADETLTVAGESMAPTFHAGDQVQLEQATETSLQRGELVAIKFSTRERKMLKRVIALPGDRVEFIGGRLKLNDQWMIADWWPTEKRMAMRDHKVLGIQLKRYKNIVPNNSLIVMGDNADRSYDSGDYGMISMAQVAGRVSQVN